MKNRLLIADRNSEPCEVYQRFLTERGYEVGASADGLDCLAKLRQVRPVVLVLDLELVWGGSDGVLAWLRENTRAPRTAVLLAGTAAAPPDSAEFREPPVEGYLSNPVARTTLPKRCCPPFVASSAAMRKGPPP